MTNFDLAFKEIIGIEGTATTNDPTDRGGLTKFGISKKSFPNVDIANLTLDKAKKIYLDNFWNTSNINLDNFDYKTALELFDIGVNQGIVTAAKTLQRALNLMNRNQKDFPDLVVDGNAGAKTIAAYKKVNKDTLLKVLNGLQFMRYVNITEKDTTQEKYFNGWMVRV